jgi:hypothetical protein
VGARERARRRRGRPAAAAATGTGDRNDPERAPPRDELEKLLSVVGKKEGGGAGLIYSPTFSPGWWFQPGLKGGL